MKTREVERIELSMDELENLLQRVKAALDEKDYQCIERLVNSYLHVIRLLEEKGVTINELRRLLFGAKSEKLRTVLDRLDEGQAMGGSTKEGVSQPTFAPDGGATGGAADAANAGGEIDQGSGKEKCKGHGRNGADAYEGAETIWFPHEDLKPHDPCPEHGCKGKLYEMEEPIVIVHVTASSRRQEI